MSQVARLSDGDFETAWNSQTMEPGATAPLFITIALPEDAQVQSFLMTVGYTKRSGGRDLFVQNMRIRHVRITHGADSFEADLDVDERGLQTIPVQGGGGEWRVELDAWVAGEREDYRELCVSELRVMGVVGSGPLPPATSMELTDDELLDELNAGRKALASSTRCGSEFSGSWTNLYNLENDVIRAFGDARIHAAINCASTSCPSLYEHAFRAEHLDAQLDEVSRRFVSNPQHVRYDGAGTLHLSAIFEWFAADFDAHQSESGERGVRAFIGEYCESQTCEAPEDATLRFNAYDWSLNTYR